jgi:hypothetical protein
VTVTLVMFSESDSERPQLVKLKRMEGGAHLVSSFEFVSVFCGIALVFLVLRKVWHSSSTTGDFLTLCCRIVEEKLTSPLLQFTRPNHPERMCIHNILKSRGVWEHLVFTRQHTYSVLKKYIKIVPAGNQREFFTAENQADGVVVTMDLTKIRLPHSARRAIKGLSAKPSHKYTGIRGRRIRSGMLSCAAALA